MSTTQGGVYSCSSSDGAYSGAQLFSGTSGTFSLTSDASWAGKTSSCAFYAWYTDGSSVAVAYLTLSFNAGTVALTPASLSLSCGSSSSTAPSAATTICSMSNSGQTAASGISYSGPGGTTVTGPSSCAANSTCSNVTVRSVTSAGTYAGTVSATPSAGSGGSSSVSLTVNSPAPAAPTISVSRSMAPLVAGKSYTTTWSTKNATSVSFTCTADGTGFAGSASVSPVSGTAAPNVAPSAWVGYPSTCTWTASGPGGSTDLVEGFTTVAGVTPAALSLTGCSNNSGTVTPNAASMTCNLNNTGGTAASGITYNSIAGMDVSGPTGSCAASSTCGQVVVTTGTAAGSYTGTLSVTASGGISASKAVNLLVNAPAAALSLSGCSVNSPTTSPSAASMSCSLSNSGGTPISSISYSALTGMTVSGPTGSCAAYSTCGAVNITTGSAANLYNGTLTITPNTGSGTSTAVNLQVTNKAVLQFSGCSINSPSNSPSPASMTCTLSNAGLVDITKIAYSALTGMTVTGPKGLCESGSDCGTVTITTGTGQGTYTGTLTATSTPNTGSNASIGINLVVSPPLTPAALSFVNCTSNNSTNSPTPATTQCMLKNTGQTAVSSISYTSFGGVNVNGPTGACAGGSNCGQVTVTTDSSAGNYSGTISASPDTGTGASKSINLTVIELANLEIFSCQVNTLTTEPTKATRQCYLRNLGGTASVVNHAIDGGMEVTGPSTCAAHSTNCGQILISTPALAGQYSGTYTVSTPNGAGQSMPVSLSVQKSPPIGTLTRTSPADVKLTIGQSFTLTWTLQNATDATVGCTDGFASVDRVAVSATGGNRVMTARTEWANKNIVCSLIANGPGGALPTTTVSFDVVPPKPTIDVSLSSSTLTVGQPFTTQWNTTNADSVSYSCTPSGAGFGTGSGLAASGETASTIAKAAWVGTSGVCVWTATGGGGSASASINMSTAYPASALSLDNCQSNSGVLEPQAATFSCKLNNAGAPIGSIGYMLGGGLLLNNPPTSCGAMTSCGDVVVKTPNAGGTYSGSLIITPSSGSELSIAVDLEVKSIVVSANLSKLEPATSTVNVGQTIRFSSSNTNATAAKLICTPAEGVGVEVGSFAASGGELSIPAKAEWKAKQVSCAVLASSSRGSAQSNAIAFNVIASLPTLQVQKISKPEGTVIDGSVWVGGSFARKWKVTDATSVSYSCFAQGGGFNETRPVLSQTVNTSAEGETPTFTPTDDWVVFSSECLWTVEGEGGQITYREPIQTVALGLLQLENCEQPNPVIYPSRTVLSCNLKNAGKQAVQTIRYETSTGLLVNGPQTTCAANSNCGQVTVSMDRLFDHLDGSLKIIPNSGAGIIRPISFNAVSDTALSFGVCTYINNVMTPGIAEARCPLLNKGFKSTDSIQYQGPAGVTIAGPTSCTSTLTTTPSNCGEVVIRTLGPAGNYQGLVTATPTTGFAASLNLDLTVRALVPAGLVRVTHQTPAIAGEPLRLNWVLSGTSTTKNAQLNCTSFDGISIPSQTLTGLSGQTVITTNSAWANKSAYCSVKAWNIDDQTEITSGDTIKFAAMTQVTPQLSLVNCQTNAPTHTPEKATYVCQLRNHGRTEIGRITYDLIPGIELTVPSSCPAATATDAASCGTVKLQTESGSNTYTGLLRISPDVGQGIVERISLKVDPATNMGMEASISLFPNKPVAGKNFTVSWTSTNSSKTALPHLYCSMSENGLSSFFASVDLPGADGEVTLATKAAWVGKQADCGIVFTPENGGETVMRSAYFQFAEATTHPATIEAHVESLPLVVGDRFKMKWATTYASIDPAYPTRFSCSSDNGGYTETRYLSGAAGEIELIVDEKWAGKQSKCSFWAFYEDNTNVAISYLDLDFKAAPPKATIEVTHSPSVLVAGEPYTISWATTNASPTSLPFYVCTSSDGGYVASASLPSYQGSLNLVADKNSGGTHSQCRFTVLSQYDRAGSQVTHDLEFVGQSAPNLQLLNCQVTTRVTTPAQASVVCDMRNSGAKNATVINISASNGIEVREAPVSCAAGLNCGKVSLFASKVGRYQDIITFIPDMLAQGAAALTLDLEVLPTPNTGGGTPGTGGGGGTTPAPQVKGDIEGIRVNNQGVLELTGWACLDGSVQPLNYSVYTEASSKLGGKLLATGIANVATENHQTKVDGLCRTPGVGHSFVIDVSADALLNAGKPLFVEVKETATSTPVELLCSNHNCTMPGAIRIGITAPEKNALYEVPAVVFMQALVANTTDPVDEVAFNINGEWIVAQADSKPNTYFAQKTGLAARAEPYPVSVRVKQGSTILTTTENMIYVGTGSRDVDLNIVAPTANASVPAGAPLNLDANAVLKQGSTATIYGVKFYANNIPVGVASKNASGHWVATWTPTQPGNVSLLAKAFDADGKELGVSFPIGLLVNSAASLVPASATPVAITITPPYLGNPDAGSLPGGLGVDKNGSATYSIPLAVPPGVNGMVPNLSLNYSSDNTTGSAGLGWSLGGISNIDRCGRVFATDGVADGVRYPVNVQLNPLDNATVVQKNDRLCLDGQRLILINGNSSDGDAYWADGAQYRTEIESFVTVTMSIVKGKHQFKVEGKDGQVMTYGDTIDSYVAGVGRADGLAHRWRLSKREDKNHNYISYYYLTETSTGESKPKAIRWGGNSAVGQAHFAKVEFGYLSRPDIRKAFLAGSPNEENLRLTSIETYTDTDAEGNSGTVANVYSLKYRQSATSSRSLLESIQIKDGLGNTLPLTTFNYGQVDEAATNGFAPIGGERVGPDLTVTPANYPTFPATVDMKHVIAADFNGDGKTDLLERDSRTGINQQQLFESNADGTNWIVSRPLAHYTIGDYQIVETGDFDGDGRLDLLAAPLIGKKDLATGSWMICFGKDRTSAGYDCSTNFEMPDSEYKLLLGVKVRRMVKDFNADGKDDIYLQFKAKVEGRDVWDEFMCLSAGAGFTCQKAKLNVGQGIDFGDPGIERPIASTSYADFDGDGRVDMVLLGRCAQEPKLGTPSVLEWNCGDEGTLGKVKVIGQPEFGMSSFYGEWLTFPNQYTTILRPLGTLTADLNADGYSDMVVGTASINDNINGLQDKKASVCYSKGDGTADCRPLAPSGGNFDHFVLTVEDYDGDGIYDVLRPNTDMWNEDDITSYQLCSIGPSGSTHRCRPWSGPTFYGVRGRLVFTSQGRDIETNINRPHSSFLGDFNGDGKTDIVTYLGAGRWQIYGVASQAKPGEALDKLISVTNGFGAQSKVVYAAANDASVYTPNAQLPEGGDAVQGKRSPVRRQLVKSAMQSTGNGAWLQTDYRYAGFAVDATGRGSLGFAQVTSTQRETGITNLSWYWQTYPHTGSVRRAQTRSISGVLLSDSSSVPDMVTIKPNNSDLVSTILPYTKSSVVSKRDLDGSFISTTTSTVAAPDVRGNVSSTTTTTTDAQGQSFIVTKASEYDTVDKVWPRSNLKKLTEQRTVPGNFVGASIARSIDYTYDGLDQVATETREKGDATLETITTYGRNAFGLVTSTQLNYFDRTQALRRNVSVAKMTYTSNGRFPATITNALKHTETKMFDARHGAVTSVKDPNGLTTSMQYDGFGRKTKQSMPDGTEIYTYQKQCGNACPTNAVNVLVQDSMRGDVRVAVPSLVFSDSSAHPVRTVTWGFDGRMIGSEVIYDSQGRAFETYQAEFVGDMVGTFINKDSVLVARNFYDDLGRVTIVESTGTSGLETNTTSYQGLTTILTNAKGQAKKEVKDVWGRMAQTIDAKEKPTYFRHDAFNSLVRTEDSLGNVVDIEYDKLGHRTKLSDPDLGQTTYEVDALGRTVKQVSPNQRKAGTATVMSYDDLGRMIARDEPSLTSRWVYDNQPEQSCADTRSCGKLIEAYTLNGSNKENTETHSFDSLGRPSVSTQQRDVLYTHTLGYDAWGRLLSEVHKRGSNTTKVFERRYNNNGYQFQVLRGLPAPTGGYQVLWQANDMNARMQLQTASLGNGLAVKRDYFQATGYLQSAKLLYGTEAKLEEAYTYEKLGNVMTRMQSWAASVNNEPAQFFSEGFSYDVLNRLETATVSGMPTQTFTYDDIGNLKSKTGVGQGTYVYTTQGTAGYDASTGASVRRPHAVQSIPGIGSFVYDDNGNLINGSGKEVSWTSFDMPYVMKKGSENSTFYYGADHQRVKQTRNGDVTIYYAAGMEVENKAGVLTIKTYWPGGLGVEIDKPDQATDLLWTHSDRIGSVIAMTDIGGNLVERLAYDSWGKRRALNGAEDIGNIIDGVKDNKGFTGHEMLDKLDLVHMNGRIYDPFTARFMSADPIIQDPLHSQSYNRYTYVWNNPTNLTDPTGFETAGENVSQQSTDNCDMSCRELRKMYDRCAAMVGNCTHYGPTGYENAPSNGRDTTGRGGIDCVTGGGGQCASRTPNNYSCDPGVQCVGVAPIMKTRSDSAEDDGIVGTVSRGLTAANDFVTSDTVVNFAQGWGGSLSFGITNRINDYFGTSSRDENSRAYKSGEIFGAVNGLALSWAQGAKAAAVASSETSWANFSHSLFPKRFLKKFENPLAKWMNKVGNRLNGDFVSAQLHTRMDAAAQFGLSRVWRAANPLFSPFRQVINRMPYMPGTALYLFGSHELEEAVDK